MRHLLIGCALLLALVGCAAHPPRCDRRLTPINRPWMPTDSISDPPLTGTHSVQAAHS